MLQDDRTLRTGVITSAHLIESQGLVNGKRGVIVASLLFFVKITFHALIITKLKGICMIVSRDLHLLTLKNKAK